MTLQFKICKRVSDESTHIHQHVYVYKAIIFKIDVTGM